MTIESRLAEYARAVDEAGARLISGELPYRGLYDMLRYHLGWTDGPGALEEGSSGKKLRPALCLLVAEAVGGDWRPALAGATAIELVHNFSLIHDDIQDGSPLRRHRATVWTRWGAAQGINAGDALLIVAEQALLETEPPLPARLTLGAFRLLNQACRALCEGQYLDLLWETQASVAVEEYLAMIERKTARLFQCAAEMGAYCSGAGPTLQRQWGLYGKALGMAFQVTDDLLGVWGPEADTGKTAALDVASRKKTLPVVLGLSGRKSPDTARLSSLFGLDRPLTSGETAEATNLLQHLGVRRRTAGLARRYRDEALAQLDQLAAGHEVAALREFTQAMLPRIAP